MLAAASPRKMCGHHYKRRCFRINGGDETPSVDFVVGQASSSSDGRAPPPLTMRVCVDCQTSTTPLWRGGPAGPKGSQSLCNACGIRYRKRKRGGLLEEAKEMEEAQKYREKQRQMWMKKKKKKVSVEQVRKVMSCTGSEEVAEAAFVLMSLSCALFFPF
ncbi:GATA transcription factor 23 [Acorus calamus]|uniref:GATA transcription factor 23 n=1 Tax=Acorus calamus TaxID=4465 RepID=A0AAV9FFH9_ACOCL|nr:GATA transcription factor 23 [Acorus calamus]